MTNFEEFLAEQMQDDEFLKEYEELEPHFVIVQAMINAYNAGMTKECLVAETGISEKYISQLENANANPNPSVKTLQKLATAMGKNAENFVCMKKYPNEKIWWEFFYTSQLL